MKYIIIPLFRLVTLPIVFLAFFIAIVCICIGALWHFDFNLVADIFRDNSDLEGLWRSDDYRVSGGKSGYYHKTLWSYIINKKTYANE